MHALHVGVVAQAPERAQQGCLARGAGVPILLVTLDWGHKTVRFGPTFTATDNFESDMARIQAAYANVRGRHDRIG